MPVRWKEVLSTAWKKIELGTRVKHRASAYEGWIGGWTDNRQSFEGNKVNPDGMQCRVYIHQHHSFRFAAEEDLEVYDDLTGVLDRTKLDFEHPIGGDEFSQLPISCRILALGLYRARPLLKSSPEYLFHTNRIDGLKQEWEHNT